ncbi:MAG: ABC transporter permease [Solirubrobacteraceae bacterium]
MEPSSDIAIDRSGWRRLRPSRAVMRFTGRRLGALVLLSIGIVVVTFVLTHLVPGNPALANLGQNPTPQEIAAFNQHNGLDKPLPVQLGIYFVHLIHGDLGISEQTGDPVANDLSSVIPATAELAILSIVISLIFGVGFGLVAALRRDGPVDFVLRILSLIGVSVPTFWLALAALYLLFFQLGIVPGGSRLSPTDVAPPHVTGMYTLDALLAGNLSTFWDALRHLLLPAIVLAVWNLGLLTRYTRSAVLEVIEQDYIRAARAKGLPTRSIVFGQILRAALPSIVTVIGLAFANVMTGAVLVENIFSWPGIGQYGFRAAVALDLPAIAGVSLFIAVVYIVVNFIVDILYGLLDPRVRIG